MKLPQNPFNKEQRTINSMKELYQKATLLLLAGALVTFPTALYSQNDHSGHNHNDHGHESAAEHEGHAHHDDHEDHAYHDEHSAEGHTDDAHTDEVTLSPEAIRHYNITTQKAERRSLTGIINVPARVHFNAEAMAHISTQVQGRVQNIAVRLGDQVQQGDLLLVIDSPELGAAQSAFLKQDAAIDAARINVEAMQTLLEVAQIAFDRAETLRESNGISITEYISRKGAVREAQANVSKANAQVRVAESERLAAENQLHIYGYRHQDCAALLANANINTRYEVHAPISGQVIDRKVTLGEVVGPTNEALMIIANMDELWVQGDVPERMISRVTVGTSARITMTALPEIVFHRTVSYMAPQLDAQTRTASVRVVVPTATAESPVVKHTEVDHADHHQEDHSGHNHSHENTRGVPDAAESVNADALLSSQLLKPGMFGQVELSLTALPGQKDMTLIVVPVDAVLTVEGSPAVFVPVSGEANTFAKRTVQIGNRVGSYYPVLSGLVEGEEFVATHPFILKADLGKAGAAHEH